MVNSGLCFVETPSLRKFRLISYTRSRPPTTSRFSLLYAFTENVVRNGQHEILGERIQQAEGDVVVLILAVNGVVGEVVQHVVHPPHVPLHGEAQSVEVDRLGYAGEGGGFLGHGEGAGDAMRQFIEAADEFD